LKVSKRQKKKERAARVVQADVYFLPVFRHASANQLEGKRQNQTPRLAQRELNEKTNNTGAMG